MTIMAEFSWICKNLKGSIPSRGQGSGTPACSRGLEGGPYCTADSLEKAAAGKAECPSADYLKILVPPRKK